ALLCLSSLDFPPQLLRSRSLSLTRSSVTADNMPICNNFNPLLQSAKFYVKNGLAPSTFKSYTYAWLKYAKFCSLHETPLYPIRINTIVAFITYCFEHLNLTPTYIRSLLAGVNFFSQLQQPSSSQSLFSNHVIKLLLNLLSTLNRSFYSPYLKSLLKSSFLLAFYGLLRLGEFTSPNNTFISSRDLAVSDLSFHPDFYSLSLKHSKTKGACTIVVARTNGQLCPFRAMFKFALLRHQLSGLPDPLFLTPEGLIMSAAWFLKHLRFLLAACHLPPSQFSGHFFRIGAATSAAAQGIPTSSLQQLGRWSSTAFSSYIRPDLSAVLSAQRSLSV
uniref:Tyr recombinase domain-containing protein n=1 Tax=Poecilia formosa TaxID=48698 RepID=A0A087Y3N6_POEFO